MWKGFLAEAMAKQTAKRGGIGVARSVEHEMLKLQGLTDLSPVTTTTPPQTWRPGVPTTTGASQ